MKTKSEAEMFDIIDIIAKDVIVKSGYVSSYNVDSNEEGGVELTIDIDGEVSGTLILSGNASVRIERLIKLVKENDKLKGLKEENKRLSGKIQKLHQVIHRD
jgi:hypothetical protein